MNFLKILKNNWWLKLMALAFSMLLWITITSTTDPENTYQITDIPIQFINEDSIFDAGMTYYTDGVESLNVEVKCRKSQFKNISASDFKATVDLSKRYSQTGRVEIELEVVNNKKLLEGNYKQLTYSVYIRTENISTKAYTIEPIVKGSLAEGYNYNVINIEPKKVNITAPDSVLETIGKVGVSVTLEGNSEDVNITGNLIVYDTEGKEINLENHTEIKLDVSEASVHVPVLKVNAIPVIVEVYGENNVASGYRYIGYECDISSVEIEGVSSEVDQIQQIVISGDDIDVSGAAGDLTIAVDINDYLPDGVHVVGERSVANIVFIIEKLSQRDFDISYSNIQINGQRDGYEYEIMGNGLVPVTVIGLSDDLDMLNVGDIKLFINVADFDSGEYLAALSVGRLDDFEINAPSAVSVKVTSVGSNSTENPSIHSTESGTPVTISPETNGGSEETISEDVPDGEN